MSEENKLAEVNASLDRFAKLIEENAEQLRRDKAEFNRRLAEDRKEAKRQRAQDLAKAKKRRAKAKKRQAEWDKRFANICDQVGGQGSTIGDITEAMTISDNIIGLVNKFEGIGVTNFAFNIRKQYKSSDSDGNSIRKQHEVDGLADGKKVAVVIEAKTTLTTVYVKHFVAKLAKFKVAYPEHSRKDIYGAVTFVRANDLALALAEQHGLFIIKTSPPDVELANDKGFVPTKVV